MSKNNITVSIDDLRQKSFNNLLAKARLRDKDNTSLDIEIPPFTYSRQDIIYALLDAGLIYIPYIRCRRGECIDVYFYFCDWFYDYSLVFYKSPNFKEEAIPDYSTERFVSSSNPQTGTFPAIMPGFKYCCLYEFERQDIKDAIRHWYNSVVEHLNEAKQQYSFKYILKSDTIDLDELDKAREEINRFYARVKDVQVRQDGHPAMVCSYYSYYLQQYRKFYNNSITYDSYLLEINDLVCWCSAYEVVLENKGL